jgi:anti-sigma B factor antagonist
VIDVKTKDENGVAIIEVAGEVDMYSSPEVRSAIISLTKSKRQVICIDLHKVSYMDSSGLATLVEGLQLTGQYKGNFKLVHLREEVLEVFELTRLDHIFEIYDSMEMALESLDKK